MQDLYGVSFTNAHNGTAVGENGTVLYTSDGGTTWLMQDGGTGRRLNAVYFIDANVGTAVGEAVTVVRTTTAGTGVEPPVAPTLTSPFNGEIVSADPTLIWESEPNALWYTVQMGLDPNFKTIRLNRTDIDSSHYQLNNLENGETYYWRVSLTDSSGTSGWSQTWSFTVVITDVAENNWGPDQFHLRQNYPNPFNPSTHIQFFIHQSSFVNLSIYDLLGRQVGVLVHEVLSPGSYTREWNAEGYPSGVYYYRIHTDNLIETRKMILMK
jgi:hypothetical protein